MEHAADHPAPQFGHARGRTEERLNLASVTGGQVTIHPLVFDRVLDTVPANGWQVVQDRDAINILLAGLRPDLPEATITDALRQDIGRQGAVLPEMRVIRVDESPRSATGIAPLIRPDLWSTPAQHG